MKTKITIIMTLVAALLLSIAAYAKGEINDEVNEPDAVSFQAYMDANTKEELLKRHQIFRIVLNEYRDGVIGETLHYYLDNDYAAWKFDYGVNWLNGHEYTMDSYIDGDTPYYVTYLSKQAEYHDEILNWARGNEFLCLTEPDRIVETIDNGGGTFSGVIEFNDPEKVKNNIAENAPDLPDDLEYEEGMAIRYNYIFSTETKDLLEYDTFLVIAGKEPVLLNVATFFYDGETYDPFEKGEPFAAYRAAMDDPLIAGEHTLLNCGIDQMDVAHPTIQVAQRRQLEAAADRRVVLPRFFCCLADEFVEVYDVQKSHLIGHASRVSFSSGDIDIVNQREKTRFPSI